MHKTEIFNLKCYNKCAILTPGRNKRGVYLLHRGDSKKTSDIKISRTYFLQATNQKTPALNEKSRAVRMCLNEFEAHSVCMLFSGAGVPLIGMFQGVAFFNF
jgi:galactose-1-phosphate uridylyltransferase